MSMVVILLTSALRRSAWTILASWCLFFPLVSLFRFAEYNLARGMVAFLMLGTLFYGAIYWAYLHGWKERLHAIGKDVGIGWGIIAIAAVLLGIYRGLAGFPARVNPGWYLAFLLLGFAILEWRAGALRTEVAGPEHGLDTLQKKILDAVAGFFQSVRELRRGELVLLWICGLLTVFDLISVADNPENFRSATGMIIVTWIVCGFVWVSFLRRGRRMGSREPTARHSVALLQKSENAAVLCSRCLHSQADHIDTKKAAIGRCQACACLSFAEK